MKKRVQWNNESELLLLKLWHERYNELKDNRRNLHIVEEISSILSSKGFPFSVYEVRAKIHNICNKYREERKKIVLQSEFSSWPIFAEVHKIIGKHKNYEFENEAKNDSTTNGSFAESTESLTETPMPQEDSIERKHEITIVKDNDDDGNTALRRGVKRSYQNAEDDNATSSFLSSKVKHFKRIAAAANCDDDAVDIDDDEDVLGAEAGNATKSCLSKLAKTVNDVVSFLIKQESEKSRNDSFLKMLNSYMLRLPDKTQDILKIEMLNTVFNAIHGEQEGDIELSEHEID